jgi:hypothetical protein
VHGGPTAHSEAALSAFIQSAVAAGFSVLDPNYRGSTGFGIAFRKAIRKTGWGGHACFCWHRRGSAKRQNPTCNRVAVDALWPSLSDNSNWRPARYPNN